MPLVAPTEPTIRLVVADASLPNGGSTAVTATVTEAGGTPAHDGTVVTFSTTLGAMHPPEAPTSRGRANATFTAGDQTVSFEVALSNEARAIRGATIAFGDGRVLDLGAAARSTVTHTYAEPGAYTVTVRAMDVAGSSRRGRSR